MIWGETREQRPRWGSAFAWLPVGLNDGRTIWLEWYEYKDDPLAVRPADRRHYRAAGSDWEPRRFDRPPPPAPLRRVIRELK